MQTRIVRAVQVAVEVHVKSLFDDVSTQAAALTYATFLSLPPPAPRRVLARRNRDHERRPDDLVPGSDRRHPGSCGDGLWSPLQQQLPSRADIGFIGLIGALWAASVLSSRAERALAKVFDVKRRNVVNRFRAVLITVVLGAVVIGGWWSARWSRATTSTA